VASSDGARVQHENFMNDGEYTPVFNWSVYSYPSIIVALFISSRGDLAKFSSRVVRLAECHRRKEERLSKYAFGGVR